MVIKLPPIWCKVTLNFCSVCYNLSEIFYFLSLNMDFVIANSADPDEMTQLGVSGIQRVYKGLPSLIFGYKSCHVLQRIEFAIALWKLVTISVK